MLQEPQNAVSYLPLLQTLLGGLLTFLGGLIGNYLIQKSQRSAEKENLASAFYGEISALLSVIENRQYIELLRKALERIKQTGEKKFTYYESSKETFVVYENNVGKIGLLPAPLPEKIVLFYTLASTLIDDLSALGKLKSGEHETSVIEGYLSELIDLVDATLKTGRDVQALMQSKALIKPDT